LSQHHSKTSWIFGEGAGAGAKGRGIHEIHFNLSFSIYVQHFQLWSANKNGSKNDRKKYKDEDGRKMHSIERKGHTARDHDMNMKLSHIPHHRHTIFIC